MLLVFHCKYFIGSKNKNKLDKEQGLKIKYQ